MLRLIPSTVITCVVLVAGCSDDTSKLAATGTGDVSNPPAQRGSSDSALSAACGSGAPLPEGKAVLRRRPYLQQTTADGVRIALTTIPGRDVTVRVTLPDETFVAEVPALVDVSAEPPNAEQHVASVTGLEPSTLYCYSLHGLTERAGFRTAPGHAAPLRFVAFGDSGSGGQEQLAVYDQIRDLPFDFLVHLGDLAYEKGAYGELEAKFFDVYRSSLRSFSVFPAIGNHDVATDAGAPYLGSFVLPGDYERRYSFDWAGVHFVALDTEHIDQDQAAWLDADLEASTAPWVIVFAHRPPYSSGAHGGSPAFRRQFGPVLAKHHVPLVLSGHEHDYERTVPLLGTTYIVSGGAGRETRPVGHSSFTAYAEDVLHVVFVEVDAKRIALHAIDGVGREFDSAVIPRAAEPDCPGGPGLPCP